MGVEQIHRTTYSPVAVWRNLYIKYSPQNVSQWIWCLQTETLQELSDATLSPLGNLKNPRWRPKWPTKGILGCPFWRPSWILQVPQQWQSCISQILQRQVLETPNPHKNVLWTQLHASGQNGHLATGLSISVFLLSREVHN